MAQLVDHSVQLRLTSTEKAKDKHGKDKDEDRQAWNSVCVTLVRPSLSGVPVGTLAKVMPPPRPERPLWQRVIIKILLVILGILSLIITLSFMAPHKTKWVVSTIGVEDQAEYLGIIESRNGTAASWSARSVLAGGTQQLRRFLGAAGRRM